MLMSLHLSIASRLLINYKTEFSEFVAELANEMGQSPDQVSGQLLDVWLKKMETVTQPERKKLLSLALASLLNSGSPLILEKIYAVFLNITETLNDIIRPDDENAGLIE